MAVSSESHNYLEKNNKADNLIEIPAMKTKDIAYNISFKAYRCFFSTLNLIEFSKKFSNLTSQKEFIIGDNHLGNIAITITCYGKYVFTNDDLLEACKRVFSFISEYLQKIEVIYEESK